MGTCFAGPGEILVRSYRSPTDWPPSEKIYAEALAESCVGCGESACGQVSPCWANAYGRKLD